MVEDAFVARALRPASTMGKVLKGLMTVGERHPDMVQVDDWGIAVDEGVSASWEEIADVYVLVIGTERHIVYELAPWAAQQRGQQGRYYPGRWRGASGLGQVQPALDPQLYDRDEFEILLAIHTRTGGRFPTPERVWRGHGQADELRRDWFGATQDRSVDWALPRPERQDLP